MRSSTYTFALLAIFGGSALWAGDAALHGVVTDPQGNSLAGVAVSLTLVGAKPVEIRSDAEGRYRSDSLSAGTWKVSAHAPGFTAIDVTLHLSEGERRVVDLQFQTLTRRTESVTVTADVSATGVEHPDPSQRVAVREELLDANSGHPGVPVSIPGLPAESASGGIKAPQYFAPGVAGDHGEPIAQFLQVGSYLLPNNLSANAHGNGYSDPNLMVPLVIETVETDGGSFNVREGNHSVDLAAIYGFRDRAEPAVNVTADGHDVDLSTTWGPGDANTHAWIALEGTWGNGFLRAPEHRRQFKWNGLRVLDFGRHQLTLLGIGYFGESKLPGLAPLGAAGLSDTIDSRQRDQTHTALVALNDVWHASTTSELQLSGFFRTYNLALYSNFGDGLIRQSEFRTAAGGNGTYIRKVNSRVAVMAGVDWLREAPRRLDLDRYPSSDGASYGPFQAVTANNVTLNLLSSFAAVSARVTPWLQVYAGWRRDQIAFENTDLLQSWNSYQRWVGFHSPKASLTLLPPGATRLPSVSFSFGESFFTNDPRIGGGTAPGTPVSRAHSWQMVASKSAVGVDWRVTLGRVTQEQSLAKLDPDTGLQYDEGAGRNRYVTVSARRVFRVGMVQASVSKADARDVASGAPIPEAPRTIVDILATLDRLPAGLHARGEFEEVGRKPLGDGFVAVPVREFRGAIERQLSSRVTAGVNFLVARGYSGQTTEMLAAAEQVVGVRLPTYATLSIRYRVGRAAR